MLELDISSYDKHSANRAVQPELRTLCEWTCMHTSHTARWDAWGWEFSLDSSLIEPKSAFQPPKLQRHLVYTAASQTSTHTLLILKDFGDIHGLQPRLKTWVISNVADVQLFSFLCIFNDYKFTVHGGAKLGLGFLFKCQSLLLFRILMEKLHTVIQTSPSPTSIPWQVTLQLLHLIYLICLALIFSTMLQLFLGPQVSGYIRHFI